MKILITGSGGISEALSEAFSSHDVYCSSRSQNQSPGDIEIWGINFLNFDMVFNCAYNENDQVKVLKFFYNNWKNNNSKTIINIGSIVADYPRAEVSRERDFFEYRYYKQALQQAFSDVVKSSQCDIRLYNPGPVETRMTSNLNCVKMTAQECAGIIKETLNNKKIKRIDFWI